MEISIATIVRFLLTTLALFAAIFVITMITPWLAKHVDNWIARYRENHSPKKDPGYGFRSIYELPSAKEEQQQDPSGEASVTDQNEERSQSDG